MKIGFNLKEKTGLIEGNVEKIIEKKMDNNYKNNVRKDIFSVLFPFAKKNEKVKKTRYQINQEEKRKNKEL